jgi:hypothetical protein
MDQRIITAVLVGLAAASSGCSTYPLPQDVTRKTTYDIVEALRCEVSVGVRASKIPLAEYEKHIVGYDFNIDASENNKLEGGALEFTHLMTGGNLKLALSGSADKKRMNKRFFRLTESFQQLVRSTEGKCDPAGGRDFLYPITGSIGLDEAVTTYARLGRLSRFKENTVFSDTLTFTTSLRGGVTPTLALAAGGAGLKLTRGTITKFDERVDEHKVAIAIAPKDDAGFGRTSTLFVGPRSAASLRREDNPATTVLQELDRLRNRDEDFRLLQQLRQLE